MPYEFYSHVMNMRRTNFEAKVAGARRVYTRLLGPLVAPAPRACFYWISRYYKPFTNSIQTYSWTLTPRLRFVIPTLQFPFSYFFKTFPTRRQHYSSKGCKKMSQESFESRWVTFQEVYLVFLLPFRVDCYNFLKAILFWIELIGFIDHGQGAFDVAIRKKIELSASINCYTMKKRFATICGYHFQK